MKKFTLLIASLFFTIGAMAQTNYGYGYPDGNTTSRDHHPVSVSITDECGVVQIVEGISTGTPYPSYFDKTENVFKVCCGETVTPKIVINGDWMHGYAYVDWNNDEQFTVNLTGDGPYASGEGNELVAWSLYGKNTDGNSGHNSNGEAVSGCQGPEFNLGSFTVPEGLAVGTKLRMRFTVMWNCIDPTGASYTNFFSDGASIIDVTLEIVAPATAEEKAELSKYIGKAGDVLDRFADKSIVKGDKIDITGKISSNAAQNNADGNTGGDDDGAGIAGLTDTDASTYFHSRWGGAAIDEDHYLQIDLGEGETLNEFVFEYAVRKTNDATTTSPAPTSIEVRVSEDGNDFSEPIVILTKDANNLPAYSDLGNTLWCSDIIKANINARYIRFTVTGSQGPGVTQWNNHYFFGLGTLNLYSTKESDMPNVIKSEYAEKYTVEQVNAINESLAAANSIDLTVNHKKEFVDGTVNELKEALSPFYHLLKVSAAGYATLFLGFDAEIPAFDGEENGVYIVKEDGINEDYISLEAIAGVIPAEAGVIVKAAEGEYDFMATNDAAANVAGNLLEGSVADEDVTVEAYVLGVVDGEVGLYKALMTDGSWLNNANKAYLPASALTTSQQTVAFYGFDWNGTTGIDEITDNREQSTVIYDLTGRRVEEITAPGIYIVGGKKVLVK